MNRTLVLIAPLLALCALGEVPTIEQSLEFRSAGGPRISPDGNYVAYSVREANWTENAFVSQLWLYDARTGRRFQLTSGKGGAGSPEWSPDSQRLLFSSDRDGKNKLYVISPFGGEAIALTDGEMPVRSYKWSPDGTMIGLVSTGPESKPRKERQEKYGEFELVDRDHLMSHLWTLKVPEVIPADPKKLPKPEQVTTGDEFTVSGFAWSPDSRYIAFSAAKDPDFDSFDTVDLYTVRLSDKHWKKIVDTYGPDSNPVWSPDGRQIAYSTANGQEYFYYLNSQIAVIPAEGGKPALLTSGFDEDPYLIAWGEDGVYFGAEQRTNDHLFRLNPATREIRRVAGSDTYSVASVSFTRDHKKMAFIGASPGEFFEVCISAVEPFRSEKITSTSEQFKDFQLAKREVISWKSTDGTPIEGILIKPADYDPTRKYPLLVVIHGGPTAVDTPYLRPDRNYPIERFAAKEALLLLPNYRGSAGYGEKFRSLNVRNLGVGDYWDVISGVDHLVKQGLVDPQRLGAMGWSQGGYISAFIACYSDRFKAVSVGAGISDWMTYYVNTDVHPFTRQYLQATPWDDPEIYKKTSPISYVTKAKTPTLIQHGERDQRVPLPNAYELYQALRDRKVPVRLVVYKGFGHGITKPKELLHVMQQNYEWFSEHIWGEKPSTEATDTQVKEAKP